MVGWKNTSPNSCLEDSAPPVIRHLGNHRQPILEVTLRILLEVFENTVLLPMGEEGEGIGVAGEIVIHLSTHGHFFIAASQCTLICANEEARSLNERKRS